MAKNTSEVTKKDPLFTYAEKVRLKRVVPLGIQHLAAAVAGIVTPALMIAEQCQLDTGSKTMLIQISLIVSGLATLLQLFPIFRIGSGLPLIVGVSYAYLPAMQAIAGDYISTNPSDPQGAVAVILGAVMAGGVVAFLVGFFIKWIRRLFPPLVTGTVVFTIGLSLYPTAVRYMAGGSSSPYFGSWPAWTVALFTLMIVIYFNYFSKGFGKLASILFGLAGGYLLAGVFTLTGIAKLVDLSSIGEASWIQGIPPLHFGVKFVPSAIVSMSVIFVVNAIQMLGDMTSTTEMGGMDRKPTIRELSGGIMSNGLFDVIGSLFGGLPVSTYSQNVGIVTTTKVINRTVFLFTAVVMVAAGIFPKFAAVLTTIPQSVIGGATISVFASISMTGVRMIASAGLTTRNTGIVGLSVALGVGITQVNSALGGFPFWINGVFGSSAVVVAAIMAVLLNLVLPKQEEQGNGTAEKKRQTKEPEIKGQP